ncbi:MAG: replication-associated recombination protein A [Saprospiraceae bacterium]|nr:replication-associated recombination protein A [Saprospiraceae bacterium]
MRPLAERMRPQFLTDYVGQAQLVGERGSLRIALEANHIPSLILWGPPGVGKTTLAQIMANTLKRPFQSLSAINSGVKDVREAIERARNQQFFDQGPPILFIDEIHRFSKSQQDSLLGAVEQGTITLIGATTENPSFEVISALLSRCQVYVLKPLAVEELKEVLVRALEKDEIMRKRDIMIEEYEALLRYSGGDARRLLNAFELVVQNCPPGPVKIDNALVEQAVQENLVLYDKGGEQHYDIVSAFIKSIRGSDPNAAVYWLARMVEGGEDVKFICRRMIISASEDIGLANPNALLLATQCFQAVQAIGYPEARIIMSQCAIYLANSPKSNSAYLAIKAAQEGVRQSGNLPVPLHLRNAPTSLMKKLDYGAAYKYAHDYQQNFIDQDYLPEDLRGQHFYEPGQNPVENRTLEVLRKRWKDRYDY